MPRLLSLDVFRGIVIAAMILVNSPGNQTAYSFLNHSMWNGCKPADLIFPFFIFIVGVSLVFSMTKRLAQGATKKELFYSILKRSIIIFLLGLLLTLFPRFDFSKLRFLGVLQRIAICYFFAAILFLKVPRIKTQLVMAGLLIIIYWLMMTYIPVPGFGAGDLTKEGNLAAYLDRLVLSGHLYQPTYDPEGILSTLPAIATAILGVVIGMCLAAPSSPRKKVKLMIIAGILGLLAGWLWSFSMPINKALWSSSFVLWTFGWGVLLFCLCYWLIDVKHHQRGLIFFKVFGVNAIAAYFLHIFFLKVQSIIHLSLPDGTIVNLRLYITHALFGWAPSPKTASLLYALSYTFFWFIVLWIFYRRRIFIKI